MEKLLDSLLKSLENGNWLVAALAAAIALAYSAKPALEFFELVRHRRDERLQSALKVDCLTEDVRDALKEEYNASLYRRFTGMSANPVMRVKVKALLEASRGELSMRDFSKASEHITLKGGQILVRLTRFDLISVTVNAVASVVLVLSGAFTSLLIATLKLPTLTQVVVLLAISLFLFITALAAFLQCLPYLVARRIAPKIQELQQASVQ